MSVSFAFIFISLNMFKKAFAIELTAEHIDEIAMVKNLGLHWIFLSFIKSKSMEKLIRQRNLITFHIFLSLDGLLSNSKNDENISIGSQVTREIIEQCFTFEKVSIKWFFFCRIVEFIFSHFFQSNGKIL